MIPENMTATEGASTEARQERKAWKPSVAEIRLGAVYRFGWKHRFSKDGIRHLLTERCGMTARSAEQLATHWLGTIPYREAS